jgi:hypothetical protein
LYIEVEKYLRLVDQVLQVMKGDEGSTLEPHFPMLHALGVTVYQLLKQYRQTREVFDVVAKIIANPKYGLKPNRVVGSAKLTKLSNFVRVKCISSAFIKYPT